MEATHTNKIKLDYWQPHVRTGKPARTIVEAYQGERLVVADYLDAYTSKRSISPPSLEVYQVVGDLSFDDIPRDIHGYRLAHPAQFLLLKACSPLPAPKNTPDTRDEARCDFFVLPRSGSSALKEQYDLLVLPETRLDAVLQYARNVKVPLDSNKAAYYYKSAQGRSLSTERIFDGRYDKDHRQDNTGPPIHIFHDCFSQFEHDARNIKVEATFMQKVIKLFDKSSAIYESENGHSAALVECLNDILGFELVKETNLGDAAPNSTYSLCLELDPRSGHESRAILMAYENNDEFGIGALSSDVQAQMSARRIWAQRDAALALNRGCCPTFLLSTSGPYLMVSGMVITKVPIVRRLTPWLSMVDVSHDSRPYEEVARVLLALQNAVVNLEQFWKELSLSLSPDEPSHSRFMPWRTSYEVSGRVVEFEYIRALEKYTSNVTFLARHVERGKKLIVVKFVASDRYGVQAHRLLADNSLAPRLLYHGPLSSTCTWLSMVVMEHISGRTLAEVDPKPGLHAQVKQALQLLHSQNLVFGDLRSRNIMIDSDNKVKLIDFDWVGVAGEATYPFRMSLNIMWAEGMGRGQVMQIHHDDDMLEMLLLK